MEALKAEVLLLTPGCNSPEQITNGNVHCISVIATLSPILSCRSKLDKSLHALKEDDEPISSTPTPYDSQDMDNSKKLLLVLVHIRQWLAQEDLAFHFDVDQSSISRILNQYLYWLFT